MYKTIICILIGLVFSIFFSLVSCTDKNTNSIHISGSTTIEPFMKKVVAQFKKKNNIKVSITTPGSMSGIDSLISGSCDIAMSSSDISSTQSALAKKNQIGIKSFLLGYDIIVPIINPRNVVSNISIDQLKDIYSGKIRNWSKLGGKNAVIEIVNRNNSSGTFRTWNNMIASGADEIGKQKVSSSSVLADIAENENAIGYISSSFVNSEIKLLMVDGFDIENQENWMGNYPIKRPLFLYVDENKFDDSIKKIIIYILMSKEVKKLFKESGFYYI